MDSLKVDNLNVESVDVLITPEELKKRAPLSEKAFKTVVESRQILQDILDRRDPRLFVVVGPCSVHNREEALDYARKLKELADEVSETIFVVMRVYFEKPRTTVGWKGLINDPHLNDSFDIEEGIQLGRKLLLDINEMGLPAGTEALDPVTPQYLSDLISWSAIEGQNHRISDTS